jgi:hypothetical protein
MLNIFCILASEASISGGGFTDNTWDLLEMLDFVLELVFVFCV